MKNIHNWKKPKQPQNPPDFGQFKFGHYASYKEKTTFSIKYQFNPSFKVPVLDKYHNVCLQVKNIIPSYCEFW